MFAQIQDNDLERIAHHEFVSFKLTILLGFKGVYSIPKYFPLNFPMI
jgi:hypothetical protein